MAFGLRESLQASSGCPIADAASCFGPVGPSMGEGRILGAGNNWPLRTTCAIRTTGKYQKLKIKPDQRPLMLQPINEEPANHFGFQSREFPDDTFQELKKMNFIDDECKMTIKLETPVQ